MHPLLQNLENRLAALPSSRSNSSMIDLLREINSALVRDHVPRLYGKSHRFMTSDYEVIEGHTVMAQTARLSTIISYDALNIERIVFEIALELERDTEGWCPHTLVHAPYVTIDPGTFEPIIPLYTTRGLLPLNKPCPPCDVSRDADLTKFGLPPLK